MTDLSGEMLRELLDAVGAHLDEMGATASIVVVGGATLAATGMIDRTTKDVDVVARAIREEGKRTLIPPDPLPPGLLEAIRRVARDYSLDETWMNTVIGAQWTRGLPKWLPEEIDWEDFGGLEVGFAGRRSLIALKLFAAVDKGQESAHYQDLLTLAPTPEELEQAASWVREQDAGESFPDLLSQVLDHAEQDLRRSS
jgi:hypothetical protein